MKQTMRDAPIPKEIALKLCAEILRDYRGKWWTLAGLQCWGCVRFSKGDPAKMCVSSQPDNRGCNLVTVRWEQINRLHTG